LQHPCKEYLFTGKCSDEKCKLPHMYLTERQKDPIHDNKFTTGIDRRADWGTARY
jgi:hypothetical protein